MTINPQFIEFAGAFCVLCAGIGILYTFIAGILVRRFFRSRGAELSEFPSVSILKPLYGEETELDLNLESLCQIDYPGEIDLVFGVQDPQDPAIHHVRALQDRHPKMAISLVIDAREYGANRKISNVVNIARAARHEVLVLSDSDIGVGPDYLRRTVAELARPGIGLVTCLYRGAPLAGLWPILSAMAIDYNFLPSVIVGLKSGLARPCFGSTIALRRSVLDRVGGFEAFADHLADDNAIGEAVRSLGLEVAVAPMLVTHSCAEQSLGALLNHELRWSRTILSVAGPSFAGMIATQPLPLTLLSLWAFGFTPWTVALLLAALASRHFLRHQVDHSAGGSLGEPGRWLMPLRDLLSFAVFCATFFVEKVSWRGRRFRVRANGMLSVTQEH